MDVLVIGAGFGGLSTAIALAEQGAKVRLCETLRYPGGCASTFEKDGCRFDAGATLISGLEPQQLFGGWLARYAPETRVDFMPSILEMRAPGLSLRVGRSRQDLVAQFCNTPGAPVAGIRSFFKQQQAVAAVLWGLFDTPELLPPFSAGSLMQHVMRSPRYARLLPLLGRSLASVLSSHGLDGFAPLRLYVDALCQITVQCSAEAAEASFALAAMDYCFRGAGHVHGGVGSLANALLSAAGLAGADVRLSTRVSGLTRQPDGLWRARTRRGDVLARAVVCNLLPAALAKLLADDEGALSKKMSSGPLAARVQEGWSAAMLYAVAQVPAGSPTHAHHLQLIADPARPLCEGNHIFVSVGGEDEPERAPAGQRTLTISTHVPLATMGARQHDVGQYVAEVQAQMRATLSARAAELSGGITSVLSASPRTFARFVGRPEGAVGGAPRRVGLHNYRHLGPQQVLPRLWMVGDSVFPGQSALATAIGGVRTANAIAGKL